MITLARRAKVSLSELTSIHPYNYWLPKPHGYSVASFRIVNSSRPPIVYGLPFAEQVRRALIRNRADTSHSEAITGKTVAGVPLEGHEHAHYFATDEDGDGRLDHVTIHCPRGFDEADVEELGSLRSIYRQGNRPEVRMILIGLGGVEMFARFVGGGNVTEPRAVATGCGAGASRDITEGTAYRLAAEFEGASATHTELTPKPVATARGSVTMPQIAEAVRRPSGIFAISTRWRSVTPFSLPRFPNRGGGKPPRPRDLPEAQLTQELIARGLPAPISIKRIEGYQAAGQPMVRWLEFHTQRFKGTSGKGLAGFEIEFGEPVAGPIAVGFGCHFGLGLFMPC